MKTRKIPMRSCVVTHEKLPKGELVRVVRTPEGNVIVDVTGKANGRGAYLKKDLSVFEKAYNSKINKLDNTYYMVGDVGNTVNKIKDKITSVILDPPRAGLDKNLTGAYLQASNIFKDNNYADDIDLLKMVRILVGLDSLTK